MRTSTRRVRDEPTGSNSPVSSTRNSLGWRLRGTFAISSRNSVPPSASSKRPTRSDFASVKAPLTWPKSSLSKTPSESPPAFTTTRGLPARGETRCTAWATVPFPDPFSPGDEDVGVGGADARSIMSRIGRMAGASAMRRGPSSPRRARFSASSRCPRRRARASSAWVARIESRRAFSQGFCTKSRAPRRMASTATSTVAHAVMTTTGSSGSRPRMRESRSRPSCPDVVSRA